MILKIDRLAELSSSNSFFILGPRGSGKSTLIRERYSENCLYIDLLDPQTEDDYRLTPHLLSQQLEGNPGLKRVIIDEVQKLPRILDLVHKIIEEKKIQFILSGSSARKLKRGDSNLLAGRAFVFYLYPLTHKELGRHFNLTQALSWGLLPQQIHFNEDRERKEYLRSYALTYLREEIRMEQIVRKLDPFRKFLEVAAQMNGKIINHSKIARDIGVDTTTVQKYYSVLEDTLVGFYLNPYHRSIRKGQRLSPKFYFFDTGVCRTLKGTLDLPLLPQTYDFGEAFEHFVILEIMKLAEYKRKSWKYFFLMTRDGVEIDLIIDRPGQSSVCIEIKSSDKVTEKDLKNLSRLGGDIPKSALYCFSREKIRKKIGKILCLHWSEGMQILFPDYEAMEMSRVGD